MKSVYAALFLGTMLIACNSSEKYFEQEEDARTNWIAVEIENEITLNGIWGSSDENIWAVGEQGSILHYDGNRWYEADNIEIQGLEEFDLSDVWGIDEENIWVVGGKWDGQIGTGIVLYFDGNTWVSQLDNASQPLVSVWASSNENVYAIGGSDEPVRILRNDGSNWQELPLNADELGSDVDLYVGTSVWGDGETVYVTTMDSLLRYDGAQWELLTGDLQSRHTALSMWGISHNNLYLAHALGYLTFWNGNELGYSLELESEQGSSVNFQDIWGTSETDIFAVGYYWEETKEPPRESFYRGALVYHFDGNRWQDQKAEHLGKKLNAVWSNGAEVAWAVGDDGVIIKYGQDD